MERNVDLYYLDAIMTHEMTPEEREEDLQRLQKESENLTDWKPM